MQFLKDHFVAIFVFGLLFFVTIFLPEEFITKSIEGLRNYGTLQGLLVVGVVLFTTTVVAPLNSLALIPVSSAIYGWFYTTVVCVIAWTLAAVVAFLIARHLGRPVIATLGFTKSLEKVESKIPRHVSFWSIVFLRIVLPVDVLSYAIGLLSSIKLTTYTAATFLGVIPFSLIFSLLGNAFYDQNYLMILALSITGFIVGVISWYFYKRSQT